MKKLYFLSVILALIVGPLLTYNSIAQNAPPPCEPTSDVGISLRNTPQDIAIYWRSVLGASHYLVDVEIPAMGFNNNYTVTAPDTTLLITGLPTSLQDNDTIRICVTTQCGQGSSSQARCREAIYKTAVATISPVYKSEVDKRCSKGIIDCYASFNRFLFGLTPPPPSHPSNIEKSDYLCPELFDRYYTYKQICDCREELSSCKTAFDCLSNTKYVISDREERCLLWSNGKTNTIAPVATSKMVPNPVQNDCELQYYLAEAGIVKVRIFSVSGQEMLHKQVQQSAGKQVFFLESNALVEGIYFYQIETPLQTYNGKFIKAL